MPRRRLSAASSSARSLVSGRPIAALRRASLAPTSRGVEAQHRRHQDRVQRAVVELEVLQAAEGVAEGVDGAEALLEGEAAFERAHHHLGAGGEVAAVGEGALEAAPDAAGAVERDRFGGRVVAGGEEGLDAVRERVEAGGGGEAGRQAEGELGIADRALRDQVRADEAELAGVGEGEERGAADLGAGAGGGRDGDDRGDGGPMRSRPP